MIETELDRRAPFVAEHVSLTPVVSAVSVVEVQPVEEAIGGKSKPARNTRCCDGGPMFLRRGGLDIPRLLRDSHNASRSLLKAASMSVIERNDCFRGRSLPADLLPEDYFAGAFQKHQQNLEDLIGETNSNPAFT